MKTTTKKKHTKTPAQRQMAMDIASDVIIQIATGQIDMIRGDYLKMPLGMKVRINSPTRRVIDLQKELKKSIGAKEAPCQVCARGALFIAKVARFDQYKIDPKKSPDRPSDIITDSGKMMDFTREAFTEQEQLAAESFFEGDSGRDWGLSPEDAMSGIARSILRNKGYFKNDVKLSECWTGLIPPPPLIDIAVALKNMKPSTIEVPINSEMEGKLSDLIDMEDKFIISDLEDIVFSNDLHPDVESFIKAVIGKLKRDKVTVPVKFEWSSNPALTPEPMSVKPAKAKSAKAKK